MARKLKTAESVHNEENNSGDEKGRSLFFSRRKAKKTTEAPLEEEEEEEDDGPLYRTLSNSYYYYVIGWGLFQSSMITACLITLRGSYMYTFRGYKKTIAHLIQRDMHKKVRPVMDEDFLIYIKALRELFVISDELTTEQLRKIHFIMQYAFGNAVSYNMDYTIDPQTLRPIKDDGMSAEHDRDDMVDNFDEDQLKKDPTFMSIREWLHSKLKANSFFVMFNLFDIPAVSLLGTTIAFSLWTLIYNVMMNKRPIIGLEEDLQEKPWIELFDKAAVHTYCQFAVMLLFWLYTLLLSFERVRFWILSNILTKACGHAVDFANILIEAVWFEAAEHPMSHFVTGLQDTGYSKGFSFRSLALSTAERAAKDSYKSQFTPKTITPGKQEDDKSTTLGTMRVDGKTYAYKVCRDDRNKLMYYWARAYNNDEKPDEAERFFDKSQGEEEEIQLMPLRSKAYRESASGNKASILANPLCACCAPMAIADDIPLNARSAHLLDLQKDAANKFAEKEATETLQDKDEELERYEDSIAPQDKSRVSWKCGGTKRAASNDQMGDDEGPKYSTSPLPPVKGSERPTPVDNTVPSPVEPTTPVSSPVIPPPPVSSPPEDDAVEDPLIDTEHVEPTRGPCGAKKSPKKADNTDATPKEAPNTNEGDDLATPTEKDTVASTPTKKGSDYASPHHITLEELDEYGKPITIKDIVVDMPSEKRAKRLMAKDRHEVRAEVRAVESQG
eukprot:GHVO01021810.1.p1 GENE.GHVO01021810.1~~GHVO01021810.1.p1  ORF type:complete len:728 (+),score=146.95 GHVO01021810.1:311-2494(+)